MSSRNSVASLPMACLLAVGFLGTAPMATATSAGLPVLKPGENAKNSVIEIKHRGRGRPLYLPIVPYSAYDYPYYYRRGFFPTHIGPGYIYYGYPYFYRTRYNDRCSYWYWRCVKSRHSRGRRSPRRQRGDCRCR
jgi:hypothetical protein